MQNLKSSLIDSFLFPTDQYLALTSWLSALYAKYMRQSDETVLPVQTGTVNSTITNLSASTAYLTIIYFLNFFGVSIEWSVLPH